MGTKHYTQQEKRAACLMVSQYGLKPTARRTGISHTALLDWLREGSQLVASTSTDITPTDSPDYQDQIQPELLPSEQGGMPGKAEKIALAEAAFMAYGLKSLDLVEATTSPEMAGKVAKSWFDTLSLLVEGRHKQGPSTVEQHIHQGPEYHRAASSNAGKRKRKRS